jgi:5-methylcytosine-specific restriction endonuclease McrA
VPFTIRLKDRVGGEVQPVRLKIDPGSRTTGLAIVREDGNRIEVLHLAEIHHKWSIKKRLEQRGNYRRRRRSANLRYRKPRFLNRARPKGWLPPSLRARVGNILSWVARYRTLLPVTALSVELARFDTQKLQDPEIKGIEYQQGELAGYEAREYLLEKWGRKCAYCGAENVPLQVEHIVPKIRGGSDRVSNLTLACGPCNQKKGNQTAKEFGHPGIQAQARQTLRDAAAVNATRWALWRALSATGLPIEVGTGGRTKYNRTRLRLPKTHALDALCVGASTPDHIVGMERAGVLSIRVRGRGQYRRTNVNKSGFPRGHLPRRKEILGFRTGDMVQAVVPKGKYAGRHEGAVVVRQSGRFDIKLNSRRVAQGISARHFTQLQRFDGYGYEWKAALPRPAGDDQLRPREVLRGKP